MTTAISLAIRHRFPKRVYVESNGVSRCQETYSPLLILQKNVSLSYVYPIMSHQPVSVYIITKNEAARIAQAVQSVIHWADEVIVVDSGSTDATVQIATALGASVLHRDWNGYGPQKRFAEEQCRNKWVLNIDADEEVTSALATEIQAAVDNAPEQQAAFQIRVTDVLPGEAAPSWHAYSYNILRLYHRDFGQMSEHPYQDRVEIRGGETSPLGGRIFHRSFISWQATVQKINFYSSQVAQQRMTSKLPKLFRLRLWTEFPLTFLKIWVGRRYALRGSIGLGVAITVAYLNLLRLLKLEEAVRMASESARDDKSLKPAA
jgi:glycosyltransferase involved in cell wall biosynthesis